MKNFEKYEKEMKEMLNTFYVAEELSGRKIECTSDLLDWLYEDYKEPLLTNEEREYLRAVIKPFRVYINRIQFKNTGIYFKYNGSYYGELPNAFNNKNIVNREFTLEELGLYE